MDVWAVSAQMIHAETEQLHITVKIEGGTALKKFPLKFYLLLSLGKGSEESNKSEKPTLVWWMQYAIKKELKRRVMPEKSC